MRSPGRASPGEHNKNLRKQRQPQKRLKKQIVRWRSTTAASRLIGQRPSETDRYTRDRLRASTLVVPLHAKRKATTDSEKQTGDLENISELLGVFYDMLEMDFLKRRNYVSDYVDCRFPFYNNVFESPWLQFEASMSPEDIADLKFWPAIVLGFVGKDRFALFKRNNREHPLIFAWHPGLPAKLWFPEQPYPANPNARWLTPFRWKTYWKTMQETNFCVFDLFDHKDKAINHEFANRGSSFRLSQDAQTSKLKLETFVADHDTYCRRTFCFFDPVEPRVANYVKLPDDLSKFENMNLVYPGRVFPSFGDH